MSQSERDAKTDRFKQGPGQPVIKTTTERPKQDIGSYLFAKELLQRHGFPHTDATSQYQLQRWIIEETFKGIQSDRTFRTGLVFPANYELVVPKDRSEVAKVIGYDLKLDDPQRVELDEIRQQRRASCFNFVDKGRRWDFRIRDGKVEYASGGAGGRAAEPKWTTGKFSQFVVFSPEYPDGEEVLLDIHFERIAADNNVVVACGRDAQKKLRIFWTTLTHNYPVELGGVKEIPAMYAKKNLKKDKLSGSWKKGPENFKRHPSLFLFDNDQILNAVQYSLLRLAAKWIPYPPAAIRVAQITLFWTICGESLLNFLLRRDTVLVSVTPNVWYEIDPIEPDPEEPDPSLSLVHSVEWLCNLVPKAIKELKKIAKPLLGERVSEPTVLTNVIDLGVANTHRYESYKRSVGGQAQAFVYPKEVGDTDFNINAVRDAIANALSLPGASWPFMSVLHKKSMVMDVIDAIIDCIKAHPGLKVLDGNGYNDGTCNFYVLAETTKNDGYGVFWIDEQEYYSEKWRLIHPRDRKYVNKGGLFSVFPYLSLLDLLLLAQTKVKALVELQWVMCLLTLALVPQLAPLLLPLLAGVTASQLQTKVQRGFDMGKFENNFDGTAPYGKLTATSRMAVSRYAVAVTTPKLLYTISYMWGTTDEQWNFRKYPEQNCDWCDHQSLRLRDDQTIVMWGVCKLGERKISGYWYQKYLPVSNKIPSKQLVGSLCDPGAENFSHPWKFACENVFNAMDCHQQIGVFEHDNNDLHYRYSACDERSQYYVAKVLEGTLPKDVLEKTPRPTWYAVKGKMDSTRRELYNPVFEDWQRNHPGEEPETLEMMLRFDHAPADSEYPYVVTYANSRDDDISEDLTAKYREGAHFNVLSGWWSNSKECVHLKFKKASRTRVFSTPAVKKATLTWDATKKTIKLGFDATDLTLRYVSLGAVINGEAKVLKGKIPVFPGKDKKLFETASIGLNELPSSVDTKCFEKNGDILYGTSVWFEDIVGHRALPEQPIEFK